MKRFKVDWETAPSRLNSAMTSNDFITRSKLENDNEIASLLCEGEDVMNFIHTSIDGDFGLSTIVIDTNVEEDGNNRTEEEKLKLEEVISRKVDEIVQNDYGVALVEY